MSVSDGVGSHAERLERLGPRTTGVGCIYLKDLTKADLGVLREIVVAPYPALSSGTYTKGAREGGTT